MSRFTGPVVHQRFDGEICGFGTTSGVRVVIGRWAKSPYGSFADAMVEHPDGGRVLVAPDADLADFVGGVYMFDTRWSATWPRRDQRDTSTSVAAR
jgi:hypothetical protein